MYFKGVGFIKNKLIVGFPSCEIFHLSFMIGMFYGLDYNVL
ncbi:hypothetical protein bcere0016_9310 [Bacillus cereus 95/8201]|nr:hypothetical protein bcere0016_9310 [Bacillus cereus 95/8201]EEM79075.1 hypothetical protein bthur0010_8700 [Bacillus thuringiensis serovar pondicheriensis BGSC 4BA1]